ncbi:MAG: hypothetical protein JXR94_14720, partial [Candidatus Hydrogenedentes bacterium]|nr:hypothetical protein [Candidatus Hydrogenedentota bacterium]
MAVVSVRPEGARRVGEVDGAYLEVYHSALGEMPVLHVSGAADALGRQHGFFVGDRILRNGRRIAAMFAEEGVPAGIVGRILDAAWERMAPHVPEGYCRELAAIAEGAQAAGVDLSATDLQRMTAVTNFDLYKREERFGEFLDPDTAAQLARGNAPGMSCTMFAVWGSRTADGKLFALRNLDWLAQTGMHEDRLVTVCRPEGAHPFVTMGYAGVVGALAGMNAEGISLSEVGAFSMAEELDGIPWTVMARRVLEESSCLEDASGIIQGARHTIGYNYLVADGDPRRIGSAEFRPRAAAFETNHAC